MGILRDIIDTVKDVSSIASDSKLRHKRTTSLSKTSLEGTLQFPVLVSKSLDIETLQMVSKGLERQYASFVQIALSMNPTLDLSTDRDAIGYLRRFHQNTNVRMGAEDITNAGFDLLKENYAGYSDELNQVLLFAAVYEGSTARLVASNKEQLESILEHVRHDVLNDKFIPRNGTYMFANSSMAKYHNVLEAKGTNPQPKRSVPDQRKGAVKASEDPYVQSPSQRAQDEGTIQRERKAFELPNNMLKDNDARKANELVPTTMHVRTILLDREGKSQGTMDFMIGIKATMHPIVSDEIVHNVVNGIQNKQKFFNFVRWTSGEIGFFKDFLFNIKGIKDDVVNRSAGASPWWITLKRRRTLSRVGQALMNRHQILPNASIVMSMEEVNFIKSEYGYDLLQPSVVDKIMSEYFLLGFAVVDNSTQIAHFLFDGQEEFQSVTFSALEREKSGGGGGNDFKDVIKLIQRV